jgi:hypothetical protein
LDSLEDDNDIEWNINPFGMDSFDESKETTEQIMSKFTTTAD